MKKIIIIVVALVALFVGAPYFTGKVAETETLKLVDKMNLSSSEYGSTEVLNYDRGFRSTKARYKYSPPTVFAGFSEEFGEIIYACDSSHGITGIDFTCALEGESAYSKFVADNLDGKDPLSVFGSISAFGGISNTIALDEVKDLDIDGSQVSFPKASITVETDSSGSEFEVNGGSDAFEIEADGQKLSVGEMTVDGDFKKIEGSLFTGDMSMKLDHINMASALGENSVKGIEVSSDAREQGDTLSSKIRLSIKEVVSPLAPFESIEDIDFSLNAKGLDKQAMIEYQEFAKQMQRDLMASAESDSAPQADPAQMAGLMPILEKMLKQGLEINTKINAKLNGKPNKIALDLKLLEPLTVAQIPALMGNPDEALKKIDMSLDASLDKDLVDSQPMAAGFIAQSPLVAAGNDDYALNLKLGDKIELNGKPMTFSELQVLVFSSLPF